ncbi:MAG: DUF2634 domain-containing protein [Lachnospiraceae bacterium]|nr:DUF2634 domain-containing protein [Lachnospiraceae bacterium]
MFPFDLDDEEDVVEEIETTTEQKDYEIDFTTGELTGRIISGLPAVIQWVRLTLGTERYYYNQFTWDYGSELEDLIGREFSGEYVENEVGRMISDALSMNDDIESISDLTVESESDKITAEFKVNTIYGSEEVTVNV